MNDDPVTDPFADLDLSARKMVAYVSVPTEWVTDNASFTRAIMAWERRLARAKARADSWAIRRAHWANVKATR